MFQIRYVTNKGTKPVKHRPYCRQPGNGIANKCGWNVVIPSVL